MSREPDLVSSRCGHQICYPDVDVRWNTKKYVLGGASSEKGSCASPHVRVSNQDRASCTTVDVLIEVSKTRECRRVFGNQQGLITITTCHMDSWAIASSINAILRAKHEFCHSARAASYDLYVKSSPHTPATEQRTKTRSVCSTLTRGSSCRPSLETKSIAHRRLMCLRRCGIVTVCSRKHQYWQEQNAVASYWTATSRNDASPFNSSVQSIVFFLTMFQLCRKQMW